MDTILIYPAGTSPSCIFAAELLRRRGLSIASAPDPHLSHLLLDVPSFRDPAADPEPLLRELPPDITVCGGGLNHPALASLRRMDLLSDPEYLARNAYITAECVLDVALPHLPCLLRDCPVLILGWGRIGKSLGALLKDLHADVTVAARGAGDRAMLKALGFSTGTVSQILPRLPRFRLLVNTVPAPQLTAPELARCHPECVKIDLASQPGLTGDGILAARGLPGIYRPEASGALIADTFCRLLDQEDTL